MNFVALRTSLGAGRSRSCWHWSASLVLTPGNAKRFEWTRESPSVSDNLVLKERVSSTLQLLAIHLAAYV